VDRGAPAAKHLRRSAHPLLTAALPAMTPDRAQLAAIEHALERRRARREGRELRFLCPAHEDRHPSARWNPDKKTWFCDVCQVGGGWRDLAARFGLELPAAAGSELLAEVEAVYDYRDAEGSLLFQVLRKRGKAFACRRPLPGGEWAWNLTGIERVLYRLPETLAAMRAGERVFVVEGEKDADRLAALGLAATTNPGGAGKWRPTYAAVLRGARAVILPDHDPAGRRHAEAVRSNVAGGAAEVRVLELEGLGEKGDVSDWIAAREGAGRTAAEIRHELEELAASAPAASMGAPLQRAPSAGRPSRVRRASDIPPQAVVFLWRPYIACGKLTLLEGDPGQGKSWIAAALATAGSRGQGLPGAAPFAPFRSLIFTAEDGLADTLRPRLDLLGADCDAVLLHDQPLDLAQGDDFAEIEQALVEHRPRLVILDPIVAYLGAKTDAYRANEVRAILAPLARLADRHGCAMLAVRHLNKSRGTRSIYAGQGSIDFTAAARSVLLAGCGADDDAERALVHIKSNLAAVGPTLAYTIDEQGFRWAGASPLRASDLLAPEATGNDLSSLDEARAFLRSLLGAGPVATNEIWAAARQAGIAEHTLRRAKQLEGIAARRQGYGPGGSWRWSLSGVPAATEGES
jgi:putative DNA primase/helicase